MAQLVKHPTLDFGSGHDLMVHGILSPSLSLPLSLSLSLSLKINKYTFKNLFKNRHIDNGTEYRTHLLFTYVCQYSQTYSLMVLVIAYMSTVI